jgi:hypothetical protein
VCEGAKEKFGNFGSFWLLASSQEHVFDPVEDNEDLAMRCWGRRKIGRQGVGTTGDDVMVMHKEFWERDELRQNGWHAYIYSMTADIVHRCHWRTEPLSFAGANECCI